MPTAHSVERAKEFKVVLRDFGGMNISSPREAIDDSEFFWLEDIMPIGRGNLQPAPGLSAALFTVAGEIGPPTYTAQFIGGATDYVFAVWKGSGNGWIINLLTLAQTKIFSGTLTSGQTAAAQWNALGILIIDPTGYWDWNISLSQSLSTLTLGGQTVTATPSVTGTVLSPATLFQSPPFLGTGCTFTPNYQVNSATVNAGGNGYAVNDTITLTDGGGTVQCVLKVTAVSGGHVQLVTVQTAGSYPGPTTSTVISVGPTGNASTTSGAGSGATFFVSIVIFSVSVSGTGTGYVNGTSGSDYEHIGGANQFVDTWTITTSNPTLTGTAIAVAFGRVWIASGRVITFTDAGKYNSFAGSGSSFIIQDQYLHNGVTALFNANNNLYIFGDESIDALSNVTVSAGVASFSRLNLTASVGTNQQQSIFAYGRSVAFANSTGFWLLSGATPERSSDKLILLIQAGNFANTVFGGPVVVNDELCMAFLLTITDTFTQSKTTRPVIALFFRGRWWLSSQGGSVIGAITSDIATTGLLPASSKQVLYGWIGPTAYQLFAGTVPSWKIITKLFDDDDALREKQALTATLAAFMNGQVTSNITVTIDTEQSATPAPNLGLFPTAQWVNQLGQTISWVNQFNNPVQWTMSPAGYFLFGPATVQSGTGRQYLGLTINGGSDVARLQLIGLRAEQTRDMLR